MRPLRGSITPLWHHNEFHGGNLFLSILGIFLWIFTEIEHFCIVRLKNSWVGNFAHYRLFTLTSWLLMTRWVIGGNFVFWIAQMGKFALPTLFTLIRIKMSSLMLMFITPILTFLVLTTKIFVYGAKFTVPLIEMIHFIGNDSWGREESELLDTK